MFEKYRDPDKSNALSWFMKFIKVAFTLGGRWVFKPGTDPFIGGMFCFIYDAKYKDVLPYWDKFPLVLPFGADKESFIGLNLHYLPNSQRKELLEFLLKLRNKKTDNEYIKISYEFLIACSKNKLVIPCIHRYLMSHVKSKIVKVDMKDWELVTMLPTQQFQKGKPY